MLTCRSLWNRLAPLARRTASRTGLKQIRGPCCVPAAPMSTGGAGASGGGGGGENMMYFLLVGAVAVEAGS
ncbi:hypothetical protein CRUP_011479, partial [Coryphaenoides rupestris]